MIKIYDLYSNKSLNKDIFITYILNISYDIINFKSAETYNILQFL